ncbi:hypothetical protein BDM02DRAFT_3191096 [Thelephora ganbajun]|uniref:Uncharacterized protein n=1 Tax=Thelephora ganbajun TaxID=370292 RepID=A0ACB6Z2J8_THEGA|nr:hypothetical protein BDM02DRAFT_3191096 [Thelephora ganbajun]
MPTDPHSFDFNELRKSQANQAYGHTSGAGKSHVNLKSTLGDRNRSKKDLSRKGSPIAYPESDMNGGSVLKSGDGYNQGDPSQNPSRMDLSKYPSLDHLTKHGKSSKSSSRLDLVIADDGSLSRRPSKKVPPKVDDHIARDSPSTEPSIYELASISTLTIDHLDLLAGYDPMVSHPPSPYDTVSSSPHRIPQVAPQKLDGSADALSPSAACSS